MRNVRPPTDPQRLTRLFRYAMDAQGVAVDANRLAGWCTFVFQSMSGHGRDYHRIEHVFDVADGANPVQTLAGLFHDVVYVQADGSLPDHQMKLLSDVVELRPDGIALLPHEAKPERLRAMLEMLFDIEPGSVLSPFGGLNEFLSALLAVNHLEQALPVTTLLKLSACIELTIPFRGPDEKGRIPAEALFQRLAAVNTEFRLGMDTDDLKQTIHLAIDVANRDLAGFALEDTAHFLDSTWKLLYESNHSLRQKTGYSLGDYQRSLSNMAEFMRRLDANRVFSRFMGVPSESSWARKTAAAKRNIALSTRYLNAKLVAVSALSALAALTGGDAPITQFMGELPTPERQSERLEDHLPEPGPSEPGVDKQIYRLLAQGRRSETLFDLKQSPLAAYIYARVGDGGLDKLVGKAIHPMDVQSALPLLHALPPDLLEDIILACGNIAVSRKEALSSLLRGDAILGQPSIYKAN